MTPSTALRNLLLIRMERVPLCFQILVYLCLHFLLGADRNDLEHNKRGTADGNTPACRSRKTKLLTLKSWEAERPCFELFAELSQQNVSLSTNLLVQELMSVTSFCLKTNPPPWPACALLFPFSSDWPGMPWLGSTLESR